MTTIRLDEQILNQLLEARDYLELCLMAAQSRDDCAPLSVGIAKATRAIRQATAGIEAGYKVATPANSEVAVDTRDKVAYTVAEFCAAHGVGKSLVYEEIAAGRLRAKKVGQRRLIPAQDAAAWLALLPSGGVT